MDHLTEKQKLLLSLYPDLFFAFDTIHVNNRDQKYINRFIVYDYIARVYKVMHPGGYYETKKLKRAVKLLLMGNETPGVPAEKNNKPAPPALQPIFENILK